MKKKLLAFLVVIMCFIPSITYASQVSSSSFKDELSSFLDRDVTDEDVHNWSLMISSLKADGISDNGIAGILGNVKHEGASGDYAIEGYGGKKTTEGVNYRKFELGKSYDYGETKPSLYTRKDGKTIGGEGHGLVQWSFGRTDNLTKYAEEHPEFGYVTVTHWKKTYNTQFSQHTCKIPSVAGQVCFMLQELNSGYKSCKESINNASSPSQAARLFHDGYEKSVGTNVGAREKSAEAAIKVIQACTGVIGEGTYTSSNVADTQLVADANVQGGIWSEAKFTTFNNLTETDLVFHSEEDLNDSQLKGVRDWKDNVSFKEENKIIHFLRIITMIFAILLILWAILLYLAFWFDTINNIIDFTLLDKITGGRLMVAPDEGDISFDPRNYKKGHPQTVNHRVIIIVVLSAIFFGVLILTGRIYSILNRVISFVRNLLGI